MDLARLRSLPKLLDPDIRAENVRCLRRAARGLYWDLAQPHAPDPIFIVGCSRAGTTVTFETLAMAPGLVSFGHEIPQFWDGLWGLKHNGWTSQEASADEARPSHREAARRFFFQRLGSGQVLDKTCINVLRITYLYRLFPQARFVYVHRDGRDNVSSLMDGWRHHGHFGLAKLLGPFPCPVSIDRGEFNEWSFFLPPRWRDYNEASLEEVCAYQWLTANRMALEARQLVPPEQWIQVRYEDVFERPVAMFEEVFDRLGLAFEEAVCHRCRTLHRRPTSVVLGPPRRQKWRGHNADAIARILPAIRGLMAELGYDPDD